MSLKTKLATAGAVAFALVAFLGATRAQPETAPPQAVGRPLADLGRTLAGIAADAPGGAQVGVAISDVMSGAEIFASNGDAQLNPASNTKIITAAAALAKLGPEFRFWTSLHGNREDAAIRGPIYLKGHADPTLESADLWAMAVALKTMGVRRVEGDVVVDDTYFDDQNLPFAFDQEPGEDNKFRAPVGAASLNENAVAITVGPGPLGMERARVTLDPPGYAALVDDAITVGQGATDLKIAAEPSEGRPRIRVYGQVQLGTRPVTYYRRIDNPSLFTGYGVKAALEAAGVAVGGDVRVGPMPPGTPLLAEHSSAPLSSVLWETGKMSNNFVTETVLKTIGAEAGKGPGTWDNATAEVASVLAGWGVAPGSYAYRNGSGLYDANRVSARQFVSVLRGVYLDATIRPEFLTQLATGGADGTIGERYRGPLTKRRVRAKTGTLSDVSALSGYVFDAEGRRPVAFSILVNKAPGYVSAARGYQEKIVTAIAEFLNN
jgi:D-alanyl-D-alanine carboxypeptidase/D-alanyl-D-alanine-endopeptidase (penicillin-binding protein 4)